MEVQCGVMITRWNRRACAIPAIQGSGQSYESIMDGGLIGNENPSFTIRKSAIDAARPGHMLADGDCIVVGGKTLKVKTVSFDVVDPSIRITTEDPAQ